MLALLMVLAISGRLYLSHGSDYYESLWNTETTASDRGAWVVCNCPVCHSEEFVSTEAELFEYNPWVTSLLFEFAIEPTTSANRIAIISSQRGPPALL